MSFCLFERLISLSVILLITGSSLYKHQVHARLGILHDVHQGHNSSDRNNFSQKDVRNIIPEVHYNESTARYLAQITAVAYCHEALIRKWTCSPCTFVSALEDLNVFEDKKQHFQGIVGYSKDVEAILVAYRGSMDIMNWIDNFTFYQKKAYKRFPDVKVHEGFYWVYQSVASDVVSLVRSLRNKYKKTRIVITGHSLGGAVASLCAFELRVLHQIPVDELYTFGEPRVGNLAYSNKLLSEIRSVFRLTHFRDIVPHLPPTWVGYYHTPREVYYDQFFLNYNLCNQTNGEDPACSNSCNPFGCRSVVDHLTYLNVTMSHLTC